MDTRVPVVRIAFRAFSLACLLLAGSALAQEFDIKERDLSVGALNFGQGDHVVIALHGNNGNRAFFKGYGDEFAKAGLRVISIDWPGNRGDFSHLRAAMKFAREQGARKVSLVGFSRGGELAANFARTQAQEGELDTIVLFSCGDDKGIPLAKTKKVFVFNRYDSIARWQPMAAEMSVEPKQVIMLGGNGHGIRALVDEKPDVMQDVIAVLKR